jgi:hypothetical protein
VRINRGIVRDIEEVEGKLRRFGASENPVKSRKSNQFIQHYGLATSPPDEAEMVTVSDDSGTKVSLGEDDPRYRPEQERGESALYTDEGDQVALRRGGNVHVKGYSSVNLESINVKYGLPVSSRYDPTLALPSNPNVGDTYIASATGSGWAINNIYRWGGTSWSATVPTNGNTAWVNNEYIGYRFDGVNWVIGSGGGSGGTPGASGYSGKSGYSGAGQSGYSGTPGQSGYSGANGQSGSIGQSGYSGAGQSGYSGQAGSIGQSGYSGTVGQSGSAGQSGYSGRSGYSGVGTSGYSGVQGTSGYSGQNERAICFSIFDADDDASVGDGMSSIAVPETLSGRNLVGAIVSVYSKGVGGTMTIQVCRRRNGVDIDMLSGKLTIGDAWFSTTCTVDTDNDDLLEGDMLFVDIDTIHSTTAAKGVFVSLRT